jgi:hypothetical protein
MLVGIFISVQAQSPEEIKAARDTYLWGEGTGVTIKRADKEALAMLISQISTQVESNFTLLKDEMSQNGNSEEFNETFHSVIKTYSSATLKNTERIVIGEEPDAKVFRYIKRTELDKIFKDRKDKILGFAHNADLAISHGQVADGLRYYYWALTLLKSHPEGSHIEYMDEMGKSHLLATWLPMQINNTFAGINIKVSEVESEDKYSLYTLFITFNNQPVTNFDYSYWDGSDWSNIVSARSGIGVIELYGVASNTEKLRVKAEYIFEGEARIDRELEDVLNKIDPIPFRNSYFKVSVTEKSSTEKPKKMVVKGDVQNAPLTEVANSVVYQKSIDKVIECIKNKNYTACKSQFTTDGYDVFDKLIHYGNAKVIGSPQLRFISFDDKVIARSVSMSFNFKSNDKQFVENVVFIFNKNGKIENLSFALSQVALDDIVQKKMWNEHDRMILVNFLESYKTAYALKRINYINHIFSDDALIITGKVVKVRPNEMNRYKSNKIVKYNRQTKQQYIKNLQYSFNSKEYINIKFEDSKIRKAGRGGEIYGVEIKQSYYSSNYGDVGYLFLMVDLNDPDEPIIHVHTWQPEIGNDDNVYGISDFN